MKSKIEIGIEWLMYLLIALLAFNLIFYELFKISLINVIWAMCISLF